MKPTRTMLLGIVVALIGIGIAQPGNNSFLFRTFIFIPAAVFNISSVISMLLILAGGVIGIIGYFQKGQNNP
jgi:hypothetical protein